MKRTGQKQVHKPYNRLKVWLKDNGVKYSDIALLLGLSQTAIMFKINGASDFYLSEVILIMNRYHIGYDYFFEDSVCLNDNKNSIREAAAESKIPMLESFLNNIETYGGIQKLFEESNKISPQYAKEIEGIYIEAIRKAVKGN